MKTFVFSEDASLQYELVSAGKQFGDVTAIVVEDVTAAESVSEFGADVICLKGAGELVDSYIPTIIKLIKDNSPELLIVGDTVIGKSVAGMVAAALDTDAVAYAKKIGLSNGKVNATQMVYGGGAIRTRQATAATLIILAKPGLADAVKAEKGNVSVVTVEPVDTGIKLRETKEKPSTNDGILTAKYVVGVGNAFDDYEQIGIARDLAAALGGEVGYTRPLIEGDPPVVPNERYIGVSGIQIKPDLYIAAGISGQTQHVVGINESKVVCCINKDGNAPIFRHSDYGIVGDLFEVLPALTEAIKQL